VPVVGGVVAHQVVGLVHEQDAVQRLVHHGIHLLGGLAHVARDQSRAVDFHQVPALEQPQPFQDPGVQTRHGGLARAGVAREHHVECDGDVAQAAFAAQDLHLEEVGKLAHLVLHRGEPHQAIELLEGVLQLELALARRGFRGRFRRGRR